MYGTLNGIVNFDRPSDPEMTMVRLTATPVWDGAGLQFMNTAGALDACHVWASGSPPPGFPITIIDEIVNMDGFLHPKTPLPQLLSMPARRKKAG